MVQRCYAATRRVIQGNAALVNGVRSSTGDRYRPGAGVDGHVAVVEQDELVLLEIEAVAIRYADQAKLVPEVADQQHVVAVAAKQAVVAQRVIGGIMAEPVGQDIRPALPGAPHQCRVVVAAVVEGDNLDTFGQLAGAAGAAACGGGRRGDGRQDMLAGLEQVLCYLSHLGHRPDTQLEMAVLTYTRWRWKLDVPQLLVATFSIRLEMP
ncbi:hypothetical protein V1517DRAFT_309416 [Lipomyces orientalis]|uniref:Uncharacterized protein n=1 Tax=Lipomyces orientalis TaxID=1233043 RepID=A0ACC3TID1_9ASCO